MSDATVVMIHGMFGGPWCWDNFRRMFEGAGWRCVAVTLPYHDVAPDAAPDPRLGTTSVLDYAAALAREIGALGTLPVLMGHSMGGLLAQLLAARGLARAAVLVAPASPAGVWGVTPSVVRGFAGILATRAFWRRPVRPTYADAAWGVLHGLPEAERRAVYDRFVHESGRAVFEMGFWPLDRRRATRVEAARVDCPVLALAGTRDRITPLAVVRRTARRYGAHATLAELPGHGHWPVGEPGWEDVAGTALNWLDGVGRASA